MNGHLDALPEELLLRVFTMVTVGDLLRCERVARRLRHAIHDNIDRLQKKAENVRFNFTKAPADVEILGPRIELRPTARFHRSDRTFSLNVDSSAKSSYDIVDVLNKWSQRGIYTVYTTRPLKFMLWMLRALSRFWTFVLIRLQEIEDLESLSECFSLLPKLQDVRFSHVNWHPLLVDLKFLPELRDLRIALASDSQHFDFFRSEVAGQVRSLIVTADELSPVFPTFSPNPTPLTDLDDLTLLSLRQLNSLFLDNVRTKLTVSGLRAILHEWIGGQRDIQDFTLYVQKTEEHRNERAVQHALHDCCPECVGRHRVRRRLLEGPTDDEVDNHLVHNSLADTLNIAVVNSGGDHWIVTIRRAS